MKLRPLPYAPMLNLRKMASFSLTEEDVLRCCHSKCFAKELASASPFSDLHHTIQSTRRIWFNKVVPLPPSSLLSITLADPFLHLLILQIDVARWSHPYHSPVFSLKVETLKIQNSLVAPMSHFGRSGSPDIKDTYSLLPTIKKPTAIVDEALATYSRCCSTADIFGLSDQLRINRRFWQPFDLQQRPSYVVSQQRSLRIGTTADDLFPLFDRYRKVIDVFIPRDRRTGDSRGFAFVREFIMSTMHWGYLDARNLAGIYYEQSQLDMAILHYKQAINSVLTLSKLTIICNMMSVAASFYKATLAVTTGISAPFNNLATIYKQQTAADGLVNRGNTFKEIGRVTEAIQDYTRAVNIRPTMPEAHANLASAYKDK
ncbi:hypothetical protein ZIOFF_071135 [Zingiber officinale]|uniref:RRM domain-containing protein n=1 Tax=Zingiber officinale TaxID=94328 RepID=A0A8J5BDX7_ZINOF|nr:hypothetical protein ZIOFF_071135 [Zingiber officinale]